MKKDLIEITKKLISLPSWVDDKNDESEIGEFIFQYLRENSNLQVEKQIVKDPVSVYCLDCQHPENKPTFIK